MKRIIAIGDIHGEFNLLVKLIEKIIHFNPEEDKLIFLGDYIDRGPHSYETILYLMNLKINFPESIILLKGNHEDFATQFVNEHDERIKNNIFAHWVLNGGDETVKSFGIDMPLLFSFVEDLALFHEEEVGDKYFVFTHAGIPVNKTLENATKDELLWSRNLSYSGRGVSVVGHTFQKEVTKYPRFKPTFNVVAVDTGACFTGKLSGYDILNDIIYETRR